MFKSKNNMLSIFQKSLQGMTMLESLFPPSRFPTCIQIPNKENYIQISIESWQSISCNQLCFRVVISFFRSFSLVHIFISDGFLGSLIQTWHYLLAVNFTDGNCK